MASAERTVKFVPADLAPGDAKSLDVATEELEVARIQSRQDPLFATAYERLWAEFGAQHEMEQREVIARRLDWHPGLAIGDHWLRYEMILVRRRGKFVAVRDHTAIVACREGAAYAVVHLSHVLVEPTWRRTGLTGWLRAWPVQAARACLATSGQSANSAITLVAEMEHADERFPNREIRLKAYEKSGFKKVDPASVNYLQPDFRPPAEIDASGGPRPLPFGLIIRRAKREQETTIHGQEVRDIVAALYKMYGSGFRERDMEGLWESVRDYPTAETKVALVPPTR